MAIPKITTEQVIGIFTRAGPLLPIEVAKKLNVDSFIAKALLSQMIEAKQIKITSERIGNEFLYFVPGQEAAARARLQTFRKAEPTASTYAAPLATTPELQKKQEQFLQRLREIEQRENKTKNTKSVLPITVEDVKILFSGRPVAVGGEILSKLKDMKLEPKVVEEVKELIAEETGIKQEELEEKPKTEITYVRKDLKNIISEVKPAQKHKERVETIDISALQAERPEKLHQSKIYEEGIGVIQAIGYLIGIGGIIISKELQKKGKDAELIVELDSAIGPMRMLAIIRDKKIINDADLNVAYNAGLDRKMPILFLTKGKLTKKAEEYHKSVHSLTVKHIGE